MHRNSRNILRIIALVVLAVCFPFLARQNSFAENLDSVSVKAAPLTTASSALDGMVRVYLSSLGSPTTLTLTVAGSYSLSTGTSLANGETLTVGFSSSTGAITLTRNGVKTNMGTYFALKRHSATGSNGIKIAQGRKPANPYPGDISFQAVQQGSGYYKLYTVAHIYIENYLYGVLPYEMGSSAPTEALKAQAVAARTYTARMMASRASGYYDVVDTTSDQVYNGTPSGYASCVAAVDATKGIVLKYNGSYTATYYSASNGGQTESISNIWGTSGYSYLSVKDDPFDLANPDCVVKKTTVYANCANTSNNLSLMALLKTKAVTALRSAGYNATIANTTLGTIQGIVAHTPMYASPSKLYTKLDFTLTATTANSSGATVSANTTVTCGIFTELESLLGMSIQSSKNELWSVSKGSSSFTLEARRYGHGLGLSQRGAMYMGKLGYTYAEILGFYFTGSNRLGCTFTNTILAADSTEVITNEESAATIDDNTQDGACTAVVKLVSSSGSLAIRAEKSTASSLLGVVANSSPVTVYSSNGAWCLIRYGGITGYVPANALSISGTAPTESSQSVTGIDGFATVTASTYLNLRASGSLSASVLTTAPKGAILTVFSKTGSWANVQYGATVAYASTDFLNFSSSYSGAIVNASATDATVTVANGEVAYLRDSASTGGAEVAQLTNGLVVSVVNDDGSWAYVTFNGVSGYILSANLTYASDTGTSGGSGSDSGTTNDQTAMVSAAVGYLRQTADESATVLAEVAMGQSVVLVSQGATWSAVRYESVSGYMLTSSLSIAPTSGGTTTTAIVATQSGSLNMRREGSAGSAILTVIPKGASITVTARASTWSAVSYGGYSGYVMSAFLQFSEDMAPSDSTGGTATTATVTTASGSLNLRQLAKAGSTILTTIPRLTVVTVNAKGAEWCNVTYSGTTGYAMTAFLVFTDAMAPDATETPTAIEPTATPDAEATDTVETTATDMLTATETPAPTATGTDSANITAIVTTTSGSLNLRSDMLPGSRVLIRIPKGATISIIEKLSTWSQTSYNGYTGYVLNSYLTFTSDTAATTPNATTATVMTASGSLNLRGAPYGNIIATIPQYATVQIQQHGSTWCYVAYGSQYGYVMTAYLSFDTKATDASATEATATPIAEATVGVTDTVTPATTDAATVQSATVVTPSGSLNLRAQASTSAEILTTIPRLATVSVLEQENDWYQVQYNGQTGYASAQYLRFSADAATVTPSPAADTGSGVSAWVYTASGSLNLRESASASAGIIVAIPRLSPVLLLTQDTTWCKVQYANQVGYAMSAYLTTAKPSELGTDATNATEKPDADATGDTADSGGATLAPTASPVPTATPSPTTETILDPTLQALPEPVPALITPANDNATITLYASCTKSSNSLLDMLANTEVQVVMQGDTWCQVIYYTQVGYCLTEGLTFFAK